MEPLPDELTRRLTALRQSFDESFAAPPPPHKTAGKVLLAIRTAGVQLAIRLEELAGVHPCRKIIPLPDKAGGLLGLAGLRGNLLAVYDLATLLGSPSAETRLRWLLVTAVDPHAALAIETLEAYIEAAETEISAVRVHDAQHEHVQELVQHQGIARGVVSIPSLMDAVHRHAAHSQ
jgi:purine-binding chemotaxis protein CheW